LPLLGAGARAELAQVGAPERLVRRYGTEAPLVLDNALAHGLSREEALAPVSPTIPVTLAELVFGVSHEGAADVGDLLDRRTRVGLVPADREIAEPLAEFLAKLFRRSGLVLHGGTTVKKRKELVDQFQREDGPPFFVLSLKAGGTGLNLTAASHVIHFDRWWNPAIENQATDRAFRIGQKKNVLVHKFICRGTVEERIDEMIARKRQVAGEVIGGTDAGETLLTEMDNDTLLQFVKLDLRQSADA
jgi:hypothetical protein